MELNVVTPFKIELKNSRNNLLNDNVQEIQDNAALAYLSKSRE